MCAAFLVHCVICALRLVCPAQFGVPAPPESPLPGPFYVMAWFRKEKKPRQPRTERLEIPADVWEKCEACGHTDIREKFLRNFSVCPNCDYHRRLRAIDYARLLFDEGSWTETETDIRSTDPLQFPDYQARIKKARTVADYDAILTAAGTMAEMPVSIGIMDFAFMGGSMGSVVGEKISRLANRSLEKKHPLIIVSASGGARMQEGVLSLMQMAKVSAVLSQLAERRIPYVSILTNPTTGGVSASFAMLGDAILAEPGAVIGFAGPRVIKQTLGQDLPEGFQTAEFLRDHGMVDCVVHRRDLKTTVARLLRHMSGKPAVAGWASA
jgi:acetyl-CoA carboxylase carboxyl transferase subunit beta